MTKLSELKSKTISTEEFNEWFAAWDKTSKVPPHIEQYFWEVTVKESDEAFGQWEQFAKYSAS